MRSDVDRLVAARAAAAARGDGGLVRELDAALRDAGYRAPQTAVRESRRETATPRKAR